MGFKDGVGRMGSLNSPNHSRCGRRIFVKGGYKSMQDFADVAQQSHTSKENLDHRIGVGGPEHPFPGSATHLDSRLCSLTVSRLLVI